MNPFEYSNSSSITINDTGNLKDFYHIVNELSKSKHVHFIEKVDEADCIEWHFTYRGKPLALQYSIFNGLALLSEKNKDVKVAANKLIQKLIMA